MDAQRRIVAAETLPERTPEALALEAMRQLAGALSSDYALSARARNSALTAHDAIGTVLQRHALLTAEHERLTEEFAQLRQDLESLRRAFSDYARVPRGDGWHPRA